MPSIQAPLPAFAAARSATAAGNTAVAITLAAITSEKHVLDGVYWSYSAAPTGGALTIEDGSGVTVFQLAIIAGGPDYVHFPRGITGTAGTAMIVTLAAGSGAIVGKLNVVASKA